MGYYTIIILLCQPSLLFPFVYNRNHNNLALFQLQHRSVFQVVCAVVRLQYIVAHTF